MYQLPISEIEPQPVLDRELWRPALQPITGRNNQPAPTQIGLNVSSLYFFTVIHSVCNKVTSITIYFVNM